MNRAQGNKYCLYKQEQVGENIILKILSLVMHRD